jgi:histidinol-phosphate aminotransferase
VEGMARVKPRADVALMEGYHSPQIPVDVRLNTNESPYPPPRAWREALVQELTTVPFNRYPDRSAQALRAALAETHGVRPNQIFAANGSNEVLQTLCLAYGGAGRSVAVFEPTYALHSHIARLTGTGVVEGRRRDDFTLDMAEVRRVLSQANPTITYLCSPNNPTGRVEPQSVVEEVVGLAPGLVVVDEAYGQFAPWSALELISDDIPLVVVRTYSKTWSMAAVRLGYCVAPSWVVAELERIALPYHLDILKQIAGRLALGFSSEMRTRVSLLVAERERLAARLESYPVDTWPSGANFILFRPRHRNGVEVWRALVERSVLVRDCSSWPHLQSCLRVTVGTPEENNAFLSALAEVLA